MTEPALTGVEDAIDPSRMSSQNMLPPTFALPARRSWVVTVSMAKGWMLAPASTVSASSRLIPTKMGCAMADRLVHPGHVLGVLIVDKALHWRPGGLQGHLPRPLRRVRATRHYRLILREFPRHLLLGGVEAGE